MTVNGQHARGVVAFDSKTGRIVASHFTHLPRGKSGEDSLEEKLRSQLGGEASLKFLHVLPGEIKTDKLYRVDQSTGKLVVTSKAGSSVGAGGAKNPEFG